VHPLESSALAAARLTARAAAIDDSRICRREKIGEAHDSGRRGHDLDAAWRQHAMARLDSGAVRPEDALATAAASAAVALAFQPGAASDSGSVQNTLSSILVSRGH